MSEEKKEKKSQSYVRVRLTPEERAEVDAYCKEHYLTISALVRMGIDNVMRGGQRR